MQYGNDSNDNETGQIVNVCVPNDLTLNMEGSPCRPLSVITGRFENNGINGVKISPTRNWFVRE